MELSEQFRKQARDCLEFSRTANSLKSQGYWVVMAQFWFNLAQHAEDREAIESIDPSTIGAAYNKRTDKSN